MDNKTEVPLNKRLRYQVDNFFSRGGTAVFSVLLSLFVISTLLMGVARVAMYYLFPDDTIDDVAFLMWHSFFQTMDTGSLAELDAQANLPGKLVAIISTFIGLILFSSMVAFITQQFEARLSALRKGKSEVLESGHTVILGFDIRAMEIMRELVEANESEDDAVVVVMANRDKEEMDDFFNDTLPHRGPTRVITRNGIQSSALSLRKIRIGQARAVLIINPSPPVASPATKNQGDYQVLKTIMAIQSVAGEENMPVVVAKLFADRNRELAEGIAPGKIVAIDEDLILAKLLVQTSRTPGLSLVYSNLVGFVGNEIYIRPIPEHLSAITFGALQFHFQDTVPLGIRRQGKIALNPDPELPLQAGDDAVVLAEDDSTIKFLDAPAMAPYELEFSSRRVMPQIEKYLIYGWNKKLPILVDEYSSYIHDGSVIDIVVPRKTEAMEKVFQQLRAKHPGVQMTLQNTNPGLSSFPARLYPQRYDNVIIMAGENGTTEEIDSETLAMLLKFRHHFRKLAGTEGIQSNTQLITEVMDSANAGIIQQTGVKDFLISNQFVSKIMAQISEEPDVRLVYDDLFSEEGSEIYLKPAWLYLERFPIDITFGELMYAAQKRKEVCFGVKLKSEEYPPDFGVYLIPDRNKQFTIQEDDLLITLAEDEL
jgi:hypothetical protein